MEELRHRLETLDLFILALKGLKCFVQADRHSLEASH